MFSGHVKRPSLSRNPKPASARYCLVDLGDGVAQEDQARSAPEARREVSPSMRKSALSRPFAQHLQPQEATLGNTTPFEERDRFVPSPEGFAFGFGVALAVPTKSRLREIVRMEHCGSTSHLFDPVSRTMILLYKLPCVKGGRAPNQPRRGSTKPQWAKRAALHANGTLSSAHS